MKRSGHQSSLHRSHYNLFERSTTLVSDDFSELSFPCFPTRGRRHCFHRCSQWHFRTSCCTHSSLRHCAESVLGTSREPCSPARCGKTTSVPSTWSDHPC